jgi:hypothetical protein
MSDSINEILGLQCTVSPERWKAAEDAIGKSIIFVVEDFVAALSYDDGTKSAISVADQEKFLQVLRGE